MPRKGGVATINAKLMWQYMTYTKNVHATGYVFPSRNLNSTPKNAKSARYLLPKSEALLAI
jgi:hypothetical protein